MFTEVVCLQTNGPFKITFLVLANLSLHKYEMHAEQEKGGEADLGTLVEKHSLVNIRFYQI